MDKARPVRARGLAGTIGGMDDTAELYRLISNLIRLGTIFAVDLASKPAKVRVASGNLKTTWLQWREARAGSTKTWNPPTVGEQVVLLCPNGDPTAAVVLAGLNCDDNPAPSASPNEWVTVYPDGARVVYDHAQSDLHVTGTKSGTVEASDTFTLKCPQILLDGNTTVTGLFTYEAGLNGKPGKGNKTVIKGDVIHEDGEMSSNGVVVDKHDHGGVERGGDKTDEPNKS